MASLKLKHLLMALVPTILFLGAFYFYRTSYPEAIIGTAKAITAAKYSTANQAELAAKYREYQQSIDKDLYSNVFDLDQLEQSTALPNWANVKTVEYEFVDYLTKSDDTGDYLFIIGKAMLVVNNSEDSGGDFELKILERYKISGGKITDYAVIF